MTWQELERSSHSDILAWADGQPWCRAMADCRQDEGWHSEGDVWTHTKMVCAQLPLLDDWSRLTPHEQTVLLFTALFHDSGKPLTSRIDPTTARITSPKHALKAEHLARSVLREIGCELTFREEIARLVRFHGRPAFLLEKPEPDHEVVSLSWLLSNKLLYLFALADTRGRTTAEMGRPEENLHLWKLVAEDNGCFDQPFPFANDQVRFHYYRQERPNLHYVPFEDYRCTVMLMSGLPGSGKDAWLAANRPGLPVVSLDDLRTESNLKPPTTRAKSSRLPGNVVGNICGRDGHSPSTRLISCGKPGAAGLISSPAMMPASRSFMSSLPCQSSSGRTRSAIVPCRSG